MKIIKFIWDRAKTNKETNGRHLIIGQHLPKKDGLKQLYVNVRGISLDILDEDFKGNETLHGLSCYSKYIDSQTVEVSKEEARKVLIEEIDRILDHMFDEDNMLKVNEEFNQ
jgi:hypothetical protein